MLTELEIQIIQAMREASDEQLAKAMELLTEMLKTSGMTDADLPKVDEEI